ncbi:hypothetical protein GUITHDRAFT_118173 [Guillardia theta CCMP2712]|uniref:Uncharacterized protein n=1 Tax=Guillardia theta (strain CCMP2712) TaxID=905079 RepID=L1IHU9_GUITC|nr:hypothetical protein GUITHDRAFT_118173 [Guillardia theta CCMP2712]EKX35682.1 hypothetical protein GUITHDRAFT_118173 [Guillardia theta CCMP2712]|eukprot:XP_005822662.1 hypothetical protein GUITHDRAFT_118173 [Guillardia theta CCMP2712]
MKRTSRGEEKKSKRKSEAAAEEEEDVPPLPPMPLSSSPWDFRQAEVKDGGGGGKKEKEGDQSSKKKQWKACPNGHPLTFFLTPHDEFFCDAHESQSFPKGTSMFGCRVCDWDACEQCTATSVKDRHKETQKAFSASSSGIAMELSKGPSGLWKCARGTDKYKNEHMYLRHEHSGVVIELVQFSTCQIQFRNRPSRPVLSCTPAGDLVPFMFTLPNLEKLLAKGGGKKLPEKVEMGNWTVYSFGEDGAVISNEMKTSKPKDSSIVEQEDGTGMEIHLCKNGDFIWMAGVAKEGKAILVQPDKDPRETTKEEAAKLLGLDASEDEEEGEGEEGEDEDET